MRPSSTSFSAFSRFTFDQMLRFERGVKRCTQCCGRSFFFNASIQPKHKATSNASGYAIDGSSAPFFAMRSHTPADFAWCLRSQAAHCAALANCSAVSLGAGALAIASPRPP